MGNPAPTRETCGKMKILGKLKNIAKLRKEIDNLAIFSEVKWETGALSGLIVENTDKDKRPHLFMKVLFTRDFASVEYSIPHEVAHPDARRLHVAKTLFTLLALLEDRDAFIPKMDDFYNKTMEALELGMEFLAIEPLRMKFELDQYEKDNKAMKTELVSLKLEKEGLNHQLLELDKRCNQLEDRVRQLDGMTDIELDREIMRWVGEHGGKLDDEGFCSAMNIGGQRLEERLDALSKRGVIRIV